MTIAPLNDSQRRAARVVGFLFLFLMVAGFFAQVYVPNKLIVDGDAAETARNIMANEGLFRVGIASNILIFAADMVLAAAFYVLLKPISQGVAMLGAFWRLAQAVMMGFNQINSLTAVLLLDGPDELQALDPDQAQALANMYIGTYNGGFDIGLIYLGLGSAVFSYLLLKSRYVPRLLATWGVFANLALTAFTLAIIVFPGAEDTAVVAVGRFVPIFIFEVTAGLWLLLKGVRDPAAAEPVHVRG